MPHVFDHRPTAQEVFDAACAFFANSAGPSTVDDACQYRNGAGRCCAVGNFIPDDKYDARMDAMCEMPKYESGSGGNALPNLLKLFGDVVPAWFYDHGNLLKSLQVIHDEQDNWTDSSVTLWNYRAVAERLRILATMRKFDPVAIGQVDERAKFPAGWAVVEA